MGAEVSFVDALSTNRGFYIYIVTLFITPLGGLSVSYDNSPKGVFDYTVIGDCLTYKNACSYNLVYT